MLTFKILILGILWKEDLYFCGKFYDLNLWYFMEKILVFPW